MFCLTNPSDQYTTMKPLISAFHRYPRWLVARPVEQASHCRRKALMEVFYKMNQGYDQGFGPTATLLGPSRWLTVDPGSERLQLESRALQDGYYKTDPWMPRRLRKPRDHLSSRVAPRMTHLSTPSSTNRRPYRRDYCMQEELFGHSKR